MGIASIAAKAFGYGKRIANITPEFLLGTGAETVGKGIKNAKGSIWTKIKSGGKALEADTIAKKAVKGGFIKRTFKELITTPKAMLQGGKIGARAAKIAGKSTAVGALKGVGKTLAKRMPMIGAVATLAIEGPSIYNAFKKGGFKAGMKECAGVGTELGCMAAGAAIGSVIPGVGTVIGGLVGGIVGMFVRNAIAPEKPSKEEAQQQTVEYSKDEIKALKTIGFSEEEITQLKANGYTIEDIEAILAQEQQKQLVAPQDNTRVENRYQPYIQDEIASLQAQNEALRQQLELYNPNINPYQQQNNQYVNPFMFNTITGGYNNYTNPYTNDMFYQQLFGLNNLNPYLQKQNYQF